jgi:hypothetical protein
VLKLELDGEYLATWWVQKPGGNTYWRCEVPSRRLPGQTLQLRFDDLVKTEDSYITMPRQKGGAAIWAFAGNATRGILMGAQQEAGCRVLMEVDDNYLITPPEIPNRATDWSYDFDLVNDKHSIRAHQRLAECVDGVVVTTEELAKPYRKLNENVYVCRNSVDVDDWPEPEKPEDGILRIGYAASHSHFYDAEDVRRALSWASEQPGVEVVMFGLKRPWSFPHVHAEWTTDLALYRKSLQWLDIGVCPLRPGTWANGKSDIKAMEYAMAGAMPIVSRTIPYQPWWDLVPTCETPKEFLKAVRYAVKNRDAVKHYATIAKNYVLDNRLIEHEIWRWKEAVGVA